ncbi:sex hormone-binding globulin [Heterodontus francisci]|uniref:sex hormone-binding globulin n=1 Tax=Heterodontus francisci TaxID=7792 RepID=UPI00355B555F
MGPARLVAAICLFCTAIADLNLYRGAGNVQSEKTFNSCFFWADNKNPSLLSLAQHWEHPIPSETLTMYLERADSFESQFDLRTYDPEGVVFFGDADAGNSWFILALRNGRPEIQIMNKHCRVAVSSGGILNDGTWRTIAVRSQKNQISLTVNGKIALLVIILPSVGLDSSLIDMRIAIGGLLINQSSLLIPLKHPLDACITNWNWLQQNTTWLVKKVASNPNLQCPTNIVPGSFFPGVGMAVFRCKDLLNESETQMNWFLRFEAVIRPKKHSGVVMALLTGTHDPLVKLEFSLQDRHEQFKLDLGTTTLISMAGPTRLCDGHRVSITISESEVALQIGDQHGAHSVAADDFVPLKTSWFSKDALLFLGGLPDVEKLGYGWHLFSGCMQDIRLQGEAVDFNQAWFKHDAISSHSCPASKPFPSP